jgi:hypothetical protein
MEEESSLEAALFLEISDDENSIEISSSPRPFQKEGPRRSSSIQSRDKDDQLKYPMPGSSILGGGLSLLSPPRWTELERYKKLKEAADTVMDSDFAELDAWLNEI